MAVLDSRSLLSWLVLACLFDAVAGERSNRFEDIWQYILTPFITMGIGYGTNMVAVKMLFHPQEEKRFLCVKIQGIFPKRQNVLAAKVGETVNAKLLRHCDIREHMLKDQFQKSLVPVVEKVVDTLLTTGLNEVHPQFEIMLATAKTLKANMHQDFVSEVVEALPRLTEKISEQMERTTKIDEMVTEKIQQMSLDEMEKMFLDFMEEEFKFIEFLGGFLGFFVGLIQALVFYFSS
eukprot:TRINITY_DN2006_c0_g3_i1.p1 TRINITY_DN2006_c0_g3~~TRINITY_DN2006_c0_g3_i1.p1  ORF type:complete len:235 (+),score=99.01 TRINITY_DN2006_c0_g3_i1:78-782(+)